MNRIEKLQVFLKEQPNDCFLKHALALELIKTGDDAGARALFESNLQQDPGYLATYYHLGKLLERRGDYIAAQSVYRSGIEQAALEPHALSELRAAAENLEDEYF